MKKCLYLALALSISAQAAEESKGVQAPIISVIQLSGRDPSSAESLVGEGRIGLRYSGTSGRIDLIPQDLLAVLRAVNAGYAHGFSEGNSSILVINPPATSQDTYNQFMDYFSLAARGDRRGAQAFLERCTGEQLVDLIQLMDYLDIDLKTELGQYLCEQLLKALESKINAGVIAYAAQVLMTEPDRDGKRHLMLQMDWPKNLFLERPVFELEGSSYGGSSWSADGQIYVVGRYRSTIDTYRFDGNYSTKLDQFSLESTAPDQVEVLYPGGTYDSALNLNSNGDLLSVRVKHENRSNDVVREETRILRLVDGQRWQQIGSIIGGGTVYWSPAGDKFAWLTERALQVYQVEDKSIMELPLATLDGVVLARGEAGTPPKIARNNSYYPTFTKWSDDGKRLLVDQFCPFADGGGRYRCASLFEIGNLSIDLILSGLQVFEGDGVVNMGTALSPDGNYVAIWNRLKRNFADGGTVSSSKYRLDLYQVQDGYLVPIWHGPEIDNPGRLVGMQWSPDSSKLVSARSDTNVLGEIYQVDNQTVMPIKIQSDSFTPSIGYPYPRLWLKGTSRFLDDKGNLYNFVTDEAGEITLKLIQNLPRELFGQRSEIGWSAETQQLYIYANYELRFYDLSNGLLGQVGEILKKVTSLQSVATGNKIVIGRNRRFFVGPVDGLVWKNSWSPFPSGLIKDLDLIQQMLVNARWFNKETAAELASDDNIARIWASLPDSVRPYMTQGLGVQIQTSGAAAGGAGQ